MNFNAFLLVALSCLSGLLAEVTVLKEVQHIYETSPKVCIKGSHFDAGENQIKLVLGARGLPPLVTGEDYQVTRDQDGQGLILKLLSHKKWADLTGLVAPVNLILSSVTFDGSENNLLPEPVTIASILSAPTVKENSEFVIHSSASDEIRIDGIGFIGARKVDIYFDPPLVKVVAYEDVSAYPISKDQVVLRLRHGYKWRESPGPLKVISVDTGAGAVKVNGEDGVVVAQVVTDFNVALCSTNTQLANNNNNNRKPHSAPVSDAPVPVGPSEVGSDFLKDLVEKKKIANQAHEQLQAVIESYERKFADKELALKAWEQQLQIKEQQLKEKEASIQAQELQVQGSIQAKDKDKRSARSAQRQQRKHW